MIQRAITYALGAALVAAIVTNCTTAARLDRERAAHAKTRADHAQLVAEAERRRAAAIAAARQTEQELNHAQATHERENAQLRADLDRARAGAAAAGDRLRIAIATAADRARAGCAAPAAADVGTPAGDPVGVLADVLRRADARAGDLAAIADARGAAGAACERRYDEARETLSR